MEKLFRVGVGFANNDITFTSGSGAPSANEPVGSLYLRTDGGHYRKTAAGAGASNWSRIPTENEITEQSAWRDPARVRDDEAYANKAAAETELNDTSTPGNLGGVDSDQFADGDRILFTNITGSNKNVFIVTGAPGSSATLVESANDATLGDRLGIVEGDSTGHEQHYNGTTWVWTGKIYSDEEGFLRAFTGKTGAGTESPTYSSSDHVSGSLENAIGQLDAEIGAPVATPESRSDNPISDQNINDNIEALDSAIGPDVTSTNYLSTSNNVNDNLSALDTGIINLIKKSLSTNITSETVVDEWLCDDYKMAKYFVVIEQASTPANSVLMEVGVGHNGSIDGSVEATAADWHVFGMMELGSAISGLAYTVGLADSGATQKVQLKVTSATNAVNVRLTRIAT